MIPLYDTLRSRRFPIVNWMLIILNGMAFYYELKLGEEGLFRFIHIWGLIPSQLASTPAAAWPTLFTSMFLHGGWFHILSNMWVLFIFGDNVENRMGSGRYLVFYMLCGIAAALTQTYLSMTSTMPVIGASGAIAGVLGAYLVLFPRSRIASLVPIFFIFTIVEVPAVLFLGFWFVSQLFSGWQSLHGADMSAVAWWAHIGGFIFGMFAVHFFVQRRY